MSEKQVEIKKEKVSMVQFIDPYDGKYGKVYNFAVAFEGDKQAYMMTSKKETNPVEVGDYLEYSKIADASSADGFSHFNKVINGKLVNCIKITDASKPAFSKFGGGGGGYVKDPNQSYNILVTTCCQKAVEYVISRHNTTIETDFEAVFNKLMEVVEPKLK